MCFTFFGVHPFVSFKDYTAKLRSAIHFLILGTSISCLKTSNSRNKRHIKEKNLLPPFNKTERREKIIIL